MTKKITLIIRGKEISFEPNLVAYNALFNTNGRGDTTASIVTYLKRIVSPENRADLDELLQLPSAPAQISAFVNDQYVPDLEISVKN